MQAGLRPLEFDGFSEITAKSILWGHQTISRIAYPHVDSYTTNDQLITLINDIKNKRLPNLAAREWLIKNVNQFPWNANTNN